jgi:hypothetical protein
MGFVSPRFSNTSPQIGQTTGSLGIASLYAAKVISYHTNRPGCPNAIITVLREVLIDHLFILRPAFQSVSRIDHERPNLTDLFGTKH